MGQLNCSTNNNSDESKIQTLSILDITNIKHSWKFVVKSGLKENGVNMMIK